jgi:hypothetical protein
MDIFLAIIMIVAFANAMERNGTRKPLTGIGDCIAWFVVSLVAIALVRIPIYVIYYGWHSGPYDPSIEMQLVSGFVAIAFWWAMTYWRIPGRIYRRLRGNQ